MRCFSARLEKVTVGRRKRTSPSFAPLFAILQREASFTQDRTSLGYWSVEFVIDINFFKRIVISGRDIEVLP